MNRQAAELIGTVFNIGKLPLAPGTWASLIATISWYIIFKDIEPLFLPIVTSFLFLIGSVASDSIVTNSKEHDPSKIVIDEWVGQWIAFTFMQVNLTTAFIGFIAFRLFDITKIGPIRSIEKLPGGWGVMADDVMAGILALLVNKFFNGLIG